MREIDRHRCVLISGSRVLYAKEPVSICGYLSSGFPTCLLRDKVSLSLQHLTLLPREVMEGCSASEAATRRLAEAPIGVVVNQWLDWSQMLYNGDWNQLAVELQRANVKVNWPWAANLRLRAASGRCIVAVSVCIYACTRPWCRSGESRSPLRMRFCYVHVAITFHDLPGPLAFCLLVRPAEKLGPGCAVRAKHWRSGRQETLGRRTSSSFVNVQYFATLVARNIGRPPHASLMANGMVRRWKLPHAPWNCTS